MRMCSLSSGSSGNCIYIGNDNTHLLIDVGISRKRVEEGLRTLDLCGSDISGILVTHEHSDHVGGLGVFLRKYHVPLYGTEKTLKKIMGMSSLGRIPEGIGNEIEKNVDFQIGDLKVRSFQTFHDAVDPVCYRVESGDRSASVVTDLGKYDETIVENIRELDCLLLEANHDIHMLEAGPYPYPLKQRVLGDRGHLSNEASGKLLSEVMHDGMKHIFLGHLSLENNFEELAYETVKLEILLGDNKYKGEEFNIAVAKRDCVTQPVEF